MNPDIRGQWRGTEYTDGLVYAYANGLPGDGWGGPGGSNYVTLVLQTQSEFSQFTYWDWGAVVSGYLVRDTAEYFIEGVPVTGFVTGEPSDVPGLIKLSLFEPSASWDCTFNGQLTISSGFRSISGKWTKTSVGDGIAVARFGSITVRQFGSVLSDPWTETFGG